MVRRTGPTNVHLRKLIRYLRKKANENNAKIWDAIADLLEKPTRQRVEINLMRLNKIVKEGETVIVPGKVLGYGNLNKKITIAAWKYSEQAKEKIEKSGSKIISIQELVEANPKGSNIRIIT